MRTSCVDLAANPFRSVDALEAQHSRVVHVESLSKESAATCTSEVQHVLPRPQLRYQYAGRAQWRLPSCLYLISWLALDFCSFHFISLTVAKMRLRSFLLALQVCIGVAHSQDLNYEYIVVGSGAGGGPLAARLALAGHRTLLIEAGEDQGDNVNYTVPGYEAKATEDPSMAWDFFVRHYSDDERQKLDFKLTYTTSDGGEYTGLDPPPDSTIKGVLYPRTATLGGCTAHNALVAVYPDRDDFQHIADLTGDSSWEPDNMRKYFVKIENISYAVPSLAGHGTDGWLGTSVAPVNLALEDGQLLNMITGSVTALASDTNTNISLADVLTGDANADSALRDS